MSQSVTAPSPDMSAYVTRDELRADLAELRLEFRTALHGVQGDVSGLRFEVADLRGDIAQLRSSVTTDIAQLRSSVTTDIAQLRSLVTTDITQLRSSVTTDIAALRVEMSASQATHLRWMVGTILGAAGGVIAALKLLPPH